MPVHEKYLQFVIENVEIKSSEQMAAELGISSTSITRYIRKLAKEGRIKLPFRFRVAQKAGDFTEAEIDAYIIRSHRSRARALKYLGICIEAYEAGVARLRVAGTLPKRRLRKPYGEMPKEVRRRVNEELRLNPHLKNRVIATKYSVPISFVQKQRFALRSQEIKAKAEPRLKSQRNSYRTWTLEDDQYLTDNFGVLQDRSIALHLGRSKLAIELRANRLGVSRKANLLTLREVTRIMGVACSVVRRWISYGKLDARRAGFAQGQHPTWNITFDALESFVKKHPMEYDPLKIDKTRYPLLSQLAMEYGIVELGKTFTKARYTEEEERFILTNFKILTVSEMAEKLRRSETSLRGKIISLRKQGYLPKTRKAGSRANSWQDWEIEFLQQNIRLLSLAEIGQVLDRSEGACRGKLYLLTRGTCPALDALARKKQQAMQAVG